MGSGDFCAGVLSRRRNQLLVLAVSSYLACLMALAVWLLVDHNLPPITNVILPMLGSAGVIGLGLAMVYRAMRNGSIGNATAISACGAALPVVVDFVTGNIHLTAALVLLMVVAGGALSVAEEGSKAAVRDSAIAAINFGLAYIFLRKLYEHGHIFFSLAGVKFFMGTGATLAYFLQIRFKTNLTTSDASLTTSHDGAKSDCHNRQGKKDVVAKRGRTTRGCTTKIRLLRINIFSKQERRQGSEGGDDMLTVGQAARLLNISPTRLLLLMKEKKLGYKMVNSHRRVPVSEVLKYRELQRLSQVVEWPTDRDGGYQQPEEQRHRSCAQQPLGAKTRGLAKRLLSSLGLYDWQGKEWALVGTVAACEAVAGAFLAYALLGTVTGAAAALTAVYPAASAILALLFAGERLSAINYFGMLLIIVGIIGFSVV